MTALLWLALVPCLYWTAGPDSVAALKDAGIDHVCVPAQEAERWKGVGVSVTPLRPDALAAREPLAVPGLVPRAGLASPTRAPWVQHNGWRFRRGPAAKYAYEVPEGKGLLAVAEASMFGVDAVVTLTSADLTRVGALFRFVSALPALNLPDIADFGVVDDGTPLTGEVMNLLVRRNLLFSVVARGDRRFPLTVRLGTRAYPRPQAADPSRFALAVRRELTDDKRSLRIFGTEVVVARLTGDATRRRVYLLNYGGRAIEGLRVRVRGEWAAGDAYVFGSGQTALADHIVADGATEFSLPRLEQYAVVDLR